MATPNDVQNAPATVTKKKAAAKKTAKSAASQKSNGKPKLPSGAARLASIPITTASVTVTGSSSGGGGMKTLSFTADFIAPTPLPAGAGTPTLPNPPKIQLQVPNGTGGWNNFGTAQDMTLVIANQKYTYTSSPVPNNTYQGVVTGNWQVMVPDSGTYGPL